MSTEVDLILMESLVVGASEALRDVAEDLLELRQGWVTHGANPDAVAWLDGVIEKTGWWGGRLAAASTAREP